MKQHTFYNRGNFEMYTRMRQMKTNFIECPAWNIQSLHDPLILVLLRRMWSRLKEDERGGFQQVWKKRIQQWLTSSTLVSGSLTSISRAFLSSRNSPSCCGKIVVKFKDDWTQFKKKISTSSTLDSYQNNNQAISDCLTSSQQGISSWSTALASCFLCQV